MTTPFKYTSDTDSMGYWAQAYANSYSEICGPKSPSIFLYDTFNIFLHDDIKARG